MKGGDAFFSVVSATAVATVVAAAGASLYILLSKSMAAAVLGPNLFSPTWSPEQGSYGLLSPIIGTAFVAALSFPMVVLFSIPLAVLIEEYARGTAKRALELLVDVGAGLPTIIYAYVGAAFLSEALRAWVEAPAHKALWFLPLFSCRPLTGLNVFTASVVLAASTVPFAVAMVREAYRMVPATYVEAAYSLGMTREEVVMVRLGLIRPAIVSAVAVSMSRVITETTIVSLVAGNQFALSACAFSPYITIPSLIVNNYGYSVIYPLMDSALFFASALLYALALALNAVGLAMASRFKAVVG